jgi:hypothetical protein
MFEEIVNIEKMKEVKKEWYLLLKIIIE